MREYLYPLISMFWLQPVWLILLNQFIALPWLVLMSARGSGRWKVTGREGRYVCHFHSWDWKNFFFFWKGDGTWEVSRNTFVLFILEMRRISFLGSSHFSLSWCCRRLFGWLVVKGVNGLRTWAERNLNGDFVPPTPQVFFNRTLPWEKTVLVYKEWIKLSGR